MEWLFGFKLNHDGLSPEGFFWRRVSEDASESKRNEAMNEAYPPAYIVKLTMRARIGGVFANEHCAYIAPSLFLWS